MDEPTEKVTLEEFTRLMVLNALSPMRVVKNLARCLSAGDDRRAVIPKVSIAAEVRGGCATEDKVCS